MALRDKTRHRQSVTVTKPKHAIFISISIYFCLSILSTFVDSPGTYGVPARTRGPGTHSAQSGTWVLKCRAESATLAAPQPPKHWCLGGSAARPDCVL